MSLLLLIIINSTLYFRHDDNLIRSARLAFSCCLGLRVLFCLKYRVVIGLNEGLDRGADASRQPVLPCVEASGKTYQTAQNMV